MIETPYLAGQNDLIEKVKHLSFLHSMRDEHIKEILTLSKLRKYTKEEIIIQEGTYDCWMYIIISGEVAVIKNNMEIARLNKTGDTIGELTIIDGKTRSATIQTKTDTLCLAIDTSVFDRFKNNDKTACYFIFYQIFSELLANRLRDSNDKVTKLTMELDILKNTKGTASTNNKYLAPFSTIKEDENI